MDSWEAWKRVSEHRQTPGQSSTGPSGGRRGTAWADPLPGPIGR